MRGRGRAGPSRSDIARSTSTMTGMPRRRASAQRSVQNSRAAALGQDRGAIVQQRRRCRAAGLSTIPDRGRSRWCARRSGSIMMVEIGVTRPGMCTRCLVSMPSCASLSKMYRLEVSRASPIGPQIEARPPSRTIPIAALSALPPQISSKWVAFTLEPRAGNAVDAKCQVAHRHADAEDARRDFRRVGVKVHARIRHAGSASPEPSPDCNRLVHRSVPAMRLPAFRPCSQRPSR